VTNERQRPPEVTTADERHADLALRCAWLRVHADQLHSIELGGQLSAQLLDFADVLEVAEAWGWFR
jgi:hypothetical protein